MDVRETLVAARKLLEDPKKWHQGYYAADAEGRSCDPTDPNATCFCSWGAIMHVRGESAHGDAQEALRAGVPRGYRRHPPVYNDSPGRKHADILKMFDRAIKKLPVAA